MITKEHSIVQYDFPHRSVHPDRLRKQRDGHYLQIAADLIGIYRENLGETRQSLHELVRRRLQSVADCPTRRIGAFAKLLDDSSEFQQDKAGAAARLRKKVYSLAASHHPLVAKRDALFESEEGVVKASIADSLGMKWSDIEAKMFADVIEYHRLLSIDNDLCAAQLLSMYNVAQTQAALYDAVSMTVWANQDFKAILRYAKLARLMHFITRNRDGYIFQFDGPASVVRDTKRYGVAFARFLPGLLSASQWRMKAVVSGPSNFRFGLSLSDQDQLKCSIQSESFDSQLEEDFAASWLQSETGGWKLAREATILHQGQTVFIPDFVLKHPSHRDVLLEIVGFWTPEYLQRKAATLEKFRDHGEILLAIASSVQGAIPEMSIPRVVFKTVLNPKEVLGKLSEIF